MLSLFDYYLFVAFKEQRTHPYNQQLSGTNDAEYIEAFAGLV